MTQSHGPYAGSRAAEMVTKSRWLTVVVGLFICLGIFTLVYVHVPRVAGGGAGTASATFNTSQGLAWNVEQIQAPQAWHQTTGSHNIIVAVIDSGIAQNVPQLKGKMWTNPGEIPGNGIDDDHNGYVDDVHGWDFRNNCPVTGTNINWHGTFVAGIIAAQPGTDKVSGVAPGIRIMDVRILDSHNLFYSSDWGKFARAIDYAVNNGARIINLSIYANERPPAVFENAIKRAAAHGVIIVGIAGNNGRDSVSYPGRYPWVLAVSATDRSDHLASFSNHGPQVAVAAPGDQVMSLFPGGIAGTGSGTSFAAPHVAGTLALILSANPSLTAYQAVQILERSCAHVGSSDQFGAGRIDAEKAVALAESMSN